MVFVGSDLGVGTLQKFKEEFPSRFFMEGVSEAQIIGMCAGMAMEGFIPYFNTIATFIARRAYEQVVLDAALHNLKVRMIASGGGLVYAPLGPTHLAIEDIAVLRTVPNMCVVAPADAEEMKRLMPLTLDWPGPMYIRLAKGGDPVVTNPDYKFEIGKAFVYCEGADACVISTGIMLKPALDAAAALKQSNISVAVVHVPTVKPFDETTIVRMAGRSKLVVTAEEGVIYGGLGSAVCEALLANGAAEGQRVIRLGIPDSFSKNYGSQDNLLSHYGLTTENIVRTIRETLG